MSNQTAEWFLLDEFQPGPGIYDDEDRPQWPIRSEDELRSILMDLSQHPPRLLCLHNLSNCVLGIGIGGEYAIVQCPTPPPDSSVLVAYANVLRATSTNYFRCGGIDTPFPPQHLLLVDEVIEIVVHFFRHQRLAPWVKWDRRYIDVAEPDKSPGDGNTLDPPDIGENICF